MQQSANGKKYLAFDLGAESGRAVLGKLQSGILTTEEVHRFPNGPIEMHGSQRWDVSRLWSEMRKALASLDGTRLESIGVDTWGVDYALLGEKGELLENPYHYRDRRTEGVMEQAFQTVPREEIYRATGIQFMPINTLFQLLAARRDDPKLFASAKQLLTMPDIFHYWLSGKAVSEYTIATTTQMIDPVQRSWAKELLQRFDLPIDLPAPLVEPGTVLGTILPQFAENSSLSGTQVIAPASHDTGSAVAAISARDGTAFLSSGTWSLVGIEVDSPVITPDALRLNFTNEGGVDGTTRLLKNVMGMWMLQGCRRSWAEKNQSYEYAELIDLAGRAAPFRCLADPDDASFLRPADMTEAIARFCDRTDQPVPNSPGEFVRAIMESLALKYRRVIRDLEQVSRQSISQIRIVGGGSKNRMLNQFTADATGRRVLAGPSEATALGNIAVQVLATGEAASLREVRSMVERSFPTEIFEPRDTSQWSEHTQRFEQYCGNNYA